MKSVLFVYFVKENGLYHAREDDGLKELRCLLEKNGIRQTQYCSDQLANVYDIVNDLVFEYVDLVCFAATKQTYEFIEGILKVLRKQKKAIQTMVIAMDDKSCRLIKDSVPTKRAAEEMGKRLGCQIAHELNKLPADYNGQNNNEKSDISLRNGVIAYFSGQYITGDREYVKHIEINAEELTEEVLSGLADKNAGNSAIYTFSKASSKKFDEIKNIAQRTDFLLTNHINYEEKRNNTFELIINGETSNYKLKKNKYSEYVEEGGETFAEIADADDLKAFLEDIRIFEQTGVINHERSWKPILMNACRWGDRAECSIKDLPRMKISNGMVYPCRDSDKSIGDLSQAHFELKKKAALTLDETERRRACSECSARDKCGRCAMLPGFISEEKYCEIMRSEYSPVVFQRKMLCVKFLLLNKVVPQLAGTDHKELLFLTKGSTAATIESGEDDYLNDYSVFFAVPKIEKWFMFCLASRKIYAISEDFYNICGLFVKGLSRKKMLAYITGEKKLSEEEADNVLNEVFKTLDKGGFVKFAGEF